LALGKVAYMTKVANRGGNLKTFRLLRLRLDESYLRWLGLRYFNFKTLVATPAHCVGCAELHQTAVVATEHLPLFD
jgi:hypothetical protein